MLRAALGGARAGLAGLVVATIAPAQGTRYVVTDLGTLPSSSVCPCFFGVGLGEAAHVVGRFFGTDGRYHGFLWRNGTMVDVGSLGGGVTQVLDVNRAGVAVGHSTLVPGGLQHAFAYREGVMTDLGTLGGDYSTARAINDLGVVAGSAQTGGREGLQRAVIWPQGRRALDLGTLGGEYAEATGINDAGHVVGWAWNAARRPRAFLWTAALGMVDLGDLGGATAVAAHISASGLVVGSAQVMGQLGSTHAFLWHGGTMVDLGVLPEAGRLGEFGPELVDTAATAVNSAGTVVGNSWPGTLRPGPFVWQAGVMTNLNDLLDAGSAGWVVTEANDINERGQIAGTARSPAGFARAVLLTPITYASTGAVGAR